MYYQYHCACCDKVVEAGQKECHACGSHNIRSPYGFWILCLVACLVTAIALKVMHVYIQSQQQEVPAQSSLFDVLQQDNKRPR